MNKNATLAVAATLISALFLFTCVQHQSISHLRQEIIAQAGKISAENIANAEKDATVSNAESRIFALDRSLSLSAQDLKSTRAELAAARQQLANYQSAQSEKESLKALSDANPVLRNGTTFVFPRLFAANGNTLMLNAEYRQTHGRSLVFKTGTELASYDMDIVHPGVLIQLSLDRETLIKNQAAMDKEKANFEALSSVERAKQIEAAGIAIEKQNKLNVAQAKLDEIQRQHQTAEAQKQHALDTDRISANADATRAKAAMINALNPY